MNAVLFTVAMFLPAQTYVYEAPKVVELTPAQRTRCEQLLAEARAHRQDQIDRMMEDAEIRLEWTRNRRNAVGEFLGYETDKGLSGNFFEYGMSPHDPQAASMPKVQFSSAVSRPRHSSLTDLRAKKRQLVQAQKQIQLMQRQGVGVERFQSRQAAYRVWEAAAGRPCFAPR